MWIANNWKDYEVIDCSCGEKLERWGNYTLVRPDPQVIWDTPKKEKGWKHMNAHYHRSKKGGGEWEFFDLPEQWSIHYGSLTFQLKPFSFKHTGLFPEQAVNWDWFSDKIRSAKRPVKVLNLFAYTGGATLAAAAAGASVTHVDASKGMVTWAKENAAASGLSGAPIRWLVKFYISIARGTPLMLQLLVVFFAPYYVFGISTPYMYRLYAVIIGFSLNYAAYFAEIYRSGIQSIPQGQREAAQVMGYGRRQTFFRIIFPQMVKRVMPPVTNEVITLVKDTSLAFAIAYTEMFTMAKQIASAQASLMPLFIAGLFYYIFNFVVAFVMEAIEKKLDYYR